MLVVGRIHPTKTTIIVARFRVTSPTLVNLIQCSLRRHGSRTEIVREQCVREVREHLFVFANSLFTNVFETNMKIVKQTSRRTLFRLANMFTNFTNMFANMQTL